MERTPSHVHAAATIAPLVTLPPAADVPVHRPPVVAPPLPRADLDIELVLHASGYVRFVKPVFDAAAALALLVVTLPIMLMIAVAIRSQLGPGVIFAQRRVGRHGRPFTMWKFRTLTLDRRSRADEYRGPDRRVSHKRDDDPRHTPLGRFLRRTHLDELPQLVNVLLAQMSLVGPRPELVEVVERCYQPWEHVRHELKPGITGLWQTSEYAGDLAHMNVHLDLEYMMTVSPWTDWKILLRTVPAIVRRPGR